MGDRPRGRNVGSGERRGPEKERGGYQAPCFEELRGPEEAQGEGGGRVPTPSLRSYPSPPRSLNLGPGSRIPGGEVRKSVGDRPRGRNVRSGTCGPGVRRGDYHEVYTWSKVLPWGPGPV